MPTAANQMRRRKRNEIGDKVVLNNKYYVPDDRKAKVWTVASKPWNLCGTEVVKLEGMSGGYAVDGLNVVEEAE